MRVSFLNTDKEYIFSKQLNIKLFEENVPLYMDTDLLRVDI